MNQQESEVLKALDVAVTAKAITPKIDELVYRVEEKLRERPAEVLALEPIPLGLYTSIPAAIASSWVFILRANTITGAEGHF